MVDDIDPNICTHIIYSFVVLDPTNYIIMLSDGGLDIDKNNIKNFINLKLRNPNLKLLVALGGWTDSRFSKYSELLADPSKRTTFVNNAVEFLKTHGFDGLDLDYEYPGYDGVSTDKAGFTAFVQELKEAFQPYGWELTAAVSAVKSTIDNAYEVPELSEALDAIHLMTYDFHGSSWELQVNHHSPLYGDAGDDLTTDVA